MNSIEQIKFLQDRLAKVERQLDTLRKLILEADQIGPNNEREFRGWEIWPVLRNWAKTK